jgi:hypothetical protein
MLILPYFALVQNGANPFMFLDNVKPLPSRTPAVRELFVLSCELDSVRIRAWQGERIDFTHRTGCYPQFMWVGAATVALLNGEICRKTLRRMGMLDRLSVFHEDIALQNRVEELLAAGLP